MPISVTARGAASATMLPGSSLPARPYLDPLRYVSQPLLRAIVDGGQEDDTRVAALCQPHESQLFAPRPKICLLGLSEKVMSCKEVIEGL